VAKAYDPVGGVCIKYETNRAVEVGRLILGFQELGQVMQNIPRTVVQTAPDEERGEPMDVDAVTTTEHKGEKVQKNMQPPSNETSGKKKKKKK
jgi:Signal recognition particle 9 kDa protein (SRP9)